MLGFVRAIKNVREDGKKDQLLIVNIYIYILLTAGHLTKKFGFKIGSSGIPCNVSRTIFSQINTAF